MEIGVPMSLMTPYGDLGTEIVFNDLSGTGTGVAPYAYQDILPGSLGEGNGYLLQFLGGFDGAPIRNPVDNKPHAHGTIRHRFRRGAKIVRIEGLVVATTREKRRILDDQLLTALNSILQRENNSEPVDCRLYWTPPGKDTRLLNVSLDSVDGMGGSGGDAAPKTFAFSLVSSRPEALSLKLTETVLVDGFGDFLPNNGNTKTWPTIKITPTETDVLFHTYTTRIVNSEGFGLYFSGVIPTGRTYIEVNMLNKTAYWDGSHENALKDLNMADSDFWAIPPSDAFSAQVDGGSATVLSNDAWVG